MQYEIDIQKALSFPHCKGNLREGNARCAIGAVLDAIQFDFQAIESTEHKSHTGHPICVQSDAFNSWLRLFRHISLNQYWMKNDCAIVDDLSRDLIRRQFITDLLICGAVVPCSQDAELAKQLLKHKELTCQTV